MILQNRSHQIKLCVESKISIVLTYALIQYLCSFLMKILPGFVNWELKILFISLFIDICCHRKSKLLG